MCKTLDSCLQAEDHEAGRSTQGGAEQPFIQCQWTDSCSAFNRLTSCSAFISTHIQPKGSQSCASCSALNRLASCSAFISAHIRHEGFSPSANWLRSQAGSHSSSGARIAGDCSIGCANRRCRCFQQHQRLVAGVQVFPTTSETGRGGKEGSSKSTAQLSTAATRSAAVCAEGAKNTARKDCSVCRKFSGQHHAAKDTDLAKGRTNIRQHRGQDQHSVAQTERSAECLACLACASVRLRVPQDAFCLEAHNTQTDTGAKLRQVADRRAQGGLEIEAQLEKVASGVDCDQWCDVGQLRVGMACSLRIVRGGCRLFHLSEEQGV